jgi:hypothetical protein
VPAELTLYGRPVGTVFDLLGEKENDITYSLGWALAESERLSSAFLEDFVPPEGTGLTADSVRLQEGISGFGFTDIELLAGGDQVHIVIEAKRGYDLPQQAQLEKYATRTQPPPTALVVCAEASADFVVGKLPPTVAGVPVLYRSWREIEALVSSTASSARHHAEKRLLRDLSRYLRGLMTMQDVSSNLVYVVSLGKEIEDTGMSFRDVVVDHDTYFCPVGGGSGRWPKEPPNYLGFRFDGQLQQVRHVEGYRISDDNYAGFEPLKGRVDWSEERHWVFSLGPVMKPMHEVRTGNLFRAQRVWVALDLLLTCKTIAEARDRTKLRLTEAGI